MSEDAAETYAKASQEGYAELYSCGKEMYMQEENGTLSMAAVGDGIVGGFSPIAEDAIVLVLGGSTLYYGADRYTEDGVTYGDLYTRSNGSSTRLAKNILLRKIRLYSDGVILAYTDYESGSGYELTMIDANGETTRIDSEVTQYIRADESTLLYRADGNLYAFDGKEKKLVKKDVDMFWCRDFMASDYTLG